MKSAVRYTVVILLSVAAGWGGMDLGKRKPEMPVPRESSRKTAGVSMMRPGHPLAVAENYSTAVAKVIAGTDSATLWAKAEVLAASPPVSGLVGIMEELLDREGEACWRRIMAMEDTRLRWTMSQALLIATAHRDVWLAHEIYQKHRDEFGERWGAPLKRDFLQAACGVSADKFIGMLDMSDDHPGAFPAAEFPTDFDFLKVADHCVSNNVMTSVPSNFMQTWATRKPGQAAVWVSLFAAGAVEEHGSKTDVSWGSDIELKDTMKHIISSKDPSRDAALANLKAIPPVVAEQIWKQIGMRVWGEIDPDLLAGATEMNQRGTYLMNALADTQDMQKLDPSWLKLPAADRKELLEKFKDPENFTDLEDLRQVAERNSVESGREPEDLEKNPAPLPYTPVQLRAFQRWHDRLEKAWGMVE